MKMIKLLRVNDRGEYAVWLMACNISRFERSSSGGSKIFLMEPDLDGCIFVAETPEDIAEMINGDEQC